MTVRFRTISCRHRRSSGRFSADLSVPAQAGGNTFRCRRPTRALRFPDERGRHTSRPDGRPGRRQ
jgi:hypothetical protein